MPGTVGVVQIDSATGQLRGQESTDGAAHIKTWDQVPGAITYGEYANASTTRQSTTYPSGATAIEITYRQNSSSGTTTAVGRAMYIVFNATSDADANGKLAAAGSRYRLALGDDLSQTFSSTVPLTRIDFLTEAAETGHSTLMLAARIPA